MGGAALVARHLHAAAKDPTHVTLLDFVQDAGDPRILTADVELRRGVTEASMNADFQFASPGWSRWTGGHASGTPRELLADPPPALRQLLQSCGSPLLAEGGAAED